MFRDLKEYQEIQSIYESKVCISDEERNLVKCFEEQNFTEEELKYLLDNIDEATSIIAKDLSEEIQSLHEETLTEQDLQEVVGKILKAAAKTGIGKKIAAAGGAKIGKGLKAIGKSKAFQNVKGGVKDLAGAALRKGKDAVKSGAKFAGKVAGGAVALGKASLPYAALAGGVVAGGAGIKKLMNRGKDKKTDTKDDKGTSFGDAIKANTPEPKSTVIQNTIKNTDKKDTPPSGGGGDKKTTPSGGGEKKMSQIEKDNRQRFGNKRVDFLKQKQKDFRARQKGEMSKDDFNKKYPKSQSAKDAYARKNPNSSQAMQNMSYEPEGTPIQETSGYDPIKNYHLANDLAKVYQKIYEPAEESLTEDVQNYNALVDFIIKEEIVSTVEEADAIIAELDSELIESYLTEGVITEGLMDAVNRVKQGVGNVAKKVGTAASGAMNKAKEVAGNVRDKVKTAVQTKIQQGRDLKSGGVDKLKQGNELRQKTQAQTADVAKKTEMSRRGDTSAQSGMGNDPGAARAKLQFLKNKRAKMNQNNSGSSNNNQSGSGGNNLGKKQRPVSSPMDMRNEAVEKDAYTVVLEYLLTQNHAATIEEANYIMTELDTETIQGIISES